MDKIVIEGGQPLRGEMRVLGAKNAALPIQCAALLADGPTTLRHVPQLSDVRTMNALLAGLGCEVAGERTLTIHPGGVSDGPLEALGATVTLSHGYVDLAAKRLTGAAFVFDLVTVGGTQNVMMAATLARGTTVLENVAREPEVVELALVLNKMGAKIRGAGTPVIEIEGVDRLSGIDHAILPDRIEAGTFMIAAAITGGDIVFRDAPVDHMHAVIAKLEQAGARCEATPEGLRVIGPGELQAIDVTTRPHPGFPTDMQAQMTVLAIAARGRSTITETIFENRFMHVPELCRLGADIAVHGTTAVVRGPSRLSGTTVMATDLRASASLVLAGLIAEGRTEIRRVYHIDRGYENIERRLQPLGARIERVSGAPG